MSSHKKWVVATSIAAALTSFASVHAYAADTAASSTSDAPVTKKEIRKENRQLASKVRHALTVTKHLDSSGITVLARGTTVTLDGNVPDDGQIQLAGNSAAKVGGVGHVTNNLEVREVGN
ncbi:hyperosmotically inducible protein [Paraburkholderia sp. GAS199]|uniref:BON domain-containing protein n=1 Tax=Paraburkholderia sp. GAS199 TaxID=3035126 RepID=UPI003D23942C